MPNRKTRRASKKTATRTRKATVLPEGYVAVPEAVLVPIYNYLMGRPVKEVEQGIVALRKAMGPAVPPQEEKPADQAAAQ